jgi:hypothetical protein
MIQVIGRGPVAMAVIAHLDDKPGSLERVQRISDHDLASAHFANEFVRRP